MVDIQRRAVLRSLAKAATTASSGAHSPHMYHHQVAKPTVATTPLSAMDALGVDVSAVDASDAAFFSALGSPAPPATSISSATASSATTTMTSSSMQSPYAFHNHGLLAMHHGEEDDNLFAAYAAEPQQHQELDDALRNNAWDLYYPPAQVPQTQTSAPFPTPVTPSSDASSSSASSPSASMSGSTLSNAGRGTMGSRPIANTPSTSRATGVRQGVKRPLERMSSSATTVPPPVPMPSPVGSAVSSMLAMRAAPATAATATATGSATSPPATTARARTANSRRTKKETDAAASASAAATAAAVAAAADGMSSGSEDADLPAAKKTKVSRERQLKINAASRRCRKKQKLELQFLRTHVVDLQSALKDQVGVLRATGSQHARVAKLATFLEESIRQVEDMSSGGRPGTPKASLYSENELHQLKATATQALAAAAAAAAAPPAPSTTAMSSESTQTLTRGESCHVRAIDPLTGYASLSADRRQTLLNIASFMRNNISLESQSFSPEVISCLPIEMDGWQLRLAITEKNYTIHNCKFFPCKVEDMYDFCWDTNVASKVSIKQGKNDYCVVTPLDTDVAHVYSKTIGKWSLSVHGVANVSYNSLVCRTFNQDTRRAMICQQSVLEDRDFQDESTIPWLFKRWVVFQPRVVDGVEGCFVEAYRTASYATGRLIYKEDNTYDSFCEHLIRRYAESNALLERMMARDDRFQHLTTPSDALLALDHEETTSDRMVKDLLLF